MNTKDAKNRTRVLTAGSNHHEYDSAGNLLIFTTLDLKYPARARRIASDLLKDCTSVRTAAGTTASVTVTFGPNPAYVIRPADTVNGAYQALYNAYVITTATDKDLSELDTEATATAGVASCIGIDKVDQRFVAGIPGSIRKPDGTPADVLDAIGIQADTDHGNGLNGLIARLNSTGERERKALLKSIGEKQQTR